jgi:hypothetical protein
VSLKKTKNKKEILDSVQSINNAMDHYQEWDSFEAWSSRDEDCYDWFDYSPNCDCSSCKQYRNSHRRGWSDHIDYDYDPAGETRWTKKVDLDSVSPERKRNRLINSVLGVEGEQKNTIENIINNK